MEFQEKRQSLENGKQNPQQHIFQTNGDETHTAPFNMFHCREDVYRALASIPVGSLDRRLLLNRTNAGSLLTDIGSNVTLYTGTPQKTGSFQEQLADISVLLIQRRRHDGSRDGLGALGGLSEIIAAETFRQLSPAEQQKCVGQKDNVILKENRPCLTEDKKTIILNNIQREVREELQNIGISQIPFSFAGLKRLPFQAVDDDYIINRWQYGKRASIVLPQCHILKITPQEAHYLITLSNQGIRETDTELFGIQQYPLTQAMYQYGDSKTTDYRYHHEWLAGWFLAAELVNGSKARQELSEALSNINGFEKRCCQMGLNAQKVLSTISGADYTASLLEKNTGRTYE